MPSSSHATSGHPSLGGLFTRILLILVLWAGLVYGMLHYVGYVIPRNYQISLARNEAAEEEAKNVANPTSATPAAASASAVAAAAPAAASATPASAASSAAPAVAAASGSTVSKAPVDKKIPHDPLLAGFNRTALTNVARFYSIVISVFCIGVIILQIFKYKHVEEEAAH